MKLATNNCSDKITCCYLCYCFHFFLYDSLWCVISRPVISLTT